MILSRRTRPIQQNDPWPEHQLCCNSVEYFAEFHGDLKDVACMQEMMISRDDEWGVSSFVCLLPAYLDLLTVGPVIIESFNWAIQDLFRRIHD